VFFFVVGLEVRRELAVGELTERSRLTVPVVAAIGGMLVPAEDDFGAAYEPLQQAHQLDKADADAAFLLGMLAVDLSHHEVAFTALRSFTSAKEKAVDSATRKQLSRAYAQLGELELSKGQRTVARRMFARAVETDPDNKGAQRILAELNTLNAR